MRSLRFIRRDALCAPQQDEALPLNPVAASRQANDGRDEKQHDRNEEDDLGDFDRGAGDTAEAKNTGDQCDDQKRDDPAEHVITSVSAFDWRDRSAPCLQNQLRPKPIAPWDGSSRLTGQEIIAHPRNEIGRETHSRKASAAPVG